jgi:hypothetical protein
MLFGETCKLLILLSGRRVSNPRRPAWEAGILPLNYSRISLPADQQTYDKNNIAQPQFKRLPGCAPQTLISNARLSSIFSGSRLWIDR